MKSWLDLSDKEKNNLIKDFESKNKGLTATKIHQINKCYLIFIIPLSLFVIMRIIVGTANNIVLCYVILGILIVLYIFNIFKINKINKDFNNWLKTKNILK